MPRLYSIASPGAGELGEPHTLALCVKRVVWVDEHGVEPVLASLLVKQRDIEND